MTHPINPPPAKDAPIPSAITASKSGHRYLVISFRKITDVPPARSASPHSSNSTIKAKKESRERGESQRNIQQNSRLRVSVKKTGYSVF